MSWIIRRLLRGAMIVISWFVIPYSWIKTFGTKRQKLPPMSNSLLEIPAVDLAQMIRTRQIKSEHVVKAYVDRCKQVNPLLNAIVEERFESALQEAKAVDEFLASTTKAVEDIERDTPLLGVPVSVKESIGLRGMSNQAGLRFEKHRRAKEDAPSVAQVRKSGAIFLLVSNTPELCMMWETFNNITGQTNNPHDLRRTPGGSSGGEASLLGAGATLLSLTSDIGGSARLPAMYTGVFGHKPTPFVVSPYGHVPTSGDPRWGEYFTVAPMTRYAVDLPLLLKCMRDPEGPAVDVDQSVDVKTINYFYMDNDGPSGLTRPLTSDMQRAILQVARHFNAQKVDIDLFKWSFDISVSQLLRIKDIETIYNHSWEDEKNKKLSTEWLKYLFGCSNHIFSSVLIGLLQKFIQSLPQRRHDQFEGIAKELKSQLVHLLGTNGVFIYPSFPTSAHQHYRIFHKLLDTSYMMVFNTLGLPVTNVMVGMDKDNLPIGVQIVASPQQDHLCLAVARELESAFGGWRKPPQAS
ncbi:fatty-acid amide hydrolase 2-A isoform X2 [Phlebotomus argentipes]|nr:fatty-acid amide hydrolase 2-A isoform X2 [Phlebotomus argentipes]